MGSRRTPAERREHNARYGYRHQRLRAAYAARIAAGEVFTCRRCDEPVTATQRWHLDHTDGGGPSEYRGVAHEACNIAAPGVRGAAADSVARYRGEDAGGGWGSAGGNPAPRVNAWWIEPEASQSATTTERERPAAW